MPTLHFGCEVWYIKSKDIDLLQSFERYAARRLQRLHYRSLNVTCVACLGWSVMNINKVRMIIFLRSILVMEDYLPAKTILVARIGEHSADGLNLYDSAMLHPILR